MRKKSRQKIGGEKPKRETKVSLRIGVVSAVLFLSFIALGGRLAQLMLFSDARVAEFSERQRFGSIKLHSPRGMIYDRNMNELAVSIKLRSVFVNPRKVKDIRSTAKQLARRLEPRSLKRRKKVYSNLVKTLKKSRKKYFVWVKRKVPPETYASLKAAKIPGVGFVKESKRFYPKRDIAAKIIGFCGIDNQGLYGLEYRYDKVMQPVTSKAVVRKDAMGRPISMPEDLEVPGAFAPLGLVLTIDERIQYVTEKALERKVLSSGAKGGVAIVMNPATGEVLAMAEQPKFNPNNYAMYSSGSWKSHAVSHTVEPGSTFKIFAAAAALEEGAVKSNEIIDCENGRYTIGNKTFKEALRHRYRLLTVSDIIAKSSNIGAIKIAERIGEEKLSDYLGRFGFGKKTGIDLPGESSGLLRPVSNWSLVSLPSLSFGQEVAVTPIQLAAGVSAFANGGYMIRPRLVRAFMRDGKIVKDVEPEIISRVLSPSTVNSITDMMVKVVEEGTGKKGAVPGFKVAGKTGTAQKIDPATKTYSEDKFLSSFVGFFPADDPKLMILVMIDEPKGLVWGGAVAGPVFSEIASRSARILRIPGENTDVYEINWAKMMKNGAGEKVEKTPEQKDKGGVYAAAQKALERFKQVVNSVKQTI